jgi:hypothetical protein
LGKSASLTESEGFDLLFCSFLNKTEDVETDRAARCYIFTPKIPISVGLDVGFFSCILWQIVIFYGHLVYVKVIWYFYGLLVYFPPFWYATPKKSGNPGDGVPHIYLWKGPLWSLMH